MNFQEITGINLAWLIPMLILIAVGLKNSNGAKVKAGWYAGLLMFGLVLFGLGISQLAYANSINALLAYEYGRGEGASSAFNHLHTLFDPTLIGGFVLLLIGAGAITIGITSCVQNRENNPGNK